MRRVWKSDEPKALVDWKVGKSWQEGLPPWKQFDTATVREPLRADQLSLCCYCCASIANGAFHVEHFQPQSVAPNLRYAWSNMLASCESFKKATFEGKPVETQVHCGHRKDNSLIDSYPLAADIEEEFRFGLDGKIYPSKSLSAERQQAVGAAIEILNLEAPSLIARRQAALTKASEDTETLGEDAWQTKYLAPLPDGTLQEFWPALSYTYKKFRNLWWPAA